ncbi:hypothetical protein ACVHNB_21385 [Streptomyces sp. YJ-C3]
MGIVRCDLRAAGVDPGSFTDKMMSYVLGELCPVPALLLEPFIAEAAEAVRVVRTDHLCKLWGQVYRPGQPPRPTLPAIKPPQGPPQPPQPESGFGGLPPL